MYPVSSFNSSTIGRPPQDTSSPLKRKRPPDAKAATVAGAIFKPKCARSIFLIESSQNYLSEMPDSLKIAAEKIEGALKEHQQSPMYLSLIRTLMIETTKKNEWSEERKLAELGIIYYYLVANKKISSGNSSLIKMRLLDMEAELLKLKAEHKQLENKELQKLFPSGRIVYLLRSFVRMIFTPDGQFNLGGCHAVRELLNTRLAIFLSEEQRLQILTVTTKLIEDSNFLNLFKDPFTIHPDLEELILIDMKLAPNEQVHFLYVRWDLLTALFTLIGGQYSGQGNCYAIASASNLMRNHCEIILPILIEMLKTGTFLIENQAIPILPLLASRRKYGVDFEREVLDKYAGNLVAFSVANAILNPEEYRSQLDQVPLGFKMDNHFGKDAGYAKEIFLSHKQNLLQQIILELFDFLGVNGKFIREINSTIEHSIRGYLFDDITKAIENTFSPSRILRNILKKFNEAFFKHFFLVNYLSWMNKRVGNKLTFDFQPEGLIYDPAVNYLPFKNIQRLYFLKDSDFIPIDTIENFNKKLIEIAQAIKQTENRPLYQQTLDILINVFQTDIWKKQVAFSIIYIWNRLKSNLDGSVYENSNSFFLLQCGGYPEAIGEWIFKKSSLNLKRTIQSAPSVKALFIQICKEINDFKAQNPNFAHQQDKKLLASTPSHVFNLTPHKFKKYWSDFALINKTVIAPAQKLWQKRPTAQERISILQTICKKEEEVGCILSKISQGAIAMHRFRKEVMQHLDPSKHHTLTEAIENQMQKIDLIEFMNSVKKILFKLNVTLGSKEEIQLTAYLKRKSEKQVSTLFTPHQLSKLMHKALIHLPKSAIFISEEQLEEEICAYYEFPQRIELGSLNWVTHLVEKPYEDRLLLKYDVDSDNVALFLKKKSCVRMCDKEFAEKFLKETYFLLPS